MDAVDAYIQSRAFLNLADTTLYKAAVSKVESYFNELKTIDSKPAQRNQVKGLQLQSRCCSISALKKMAGNQLEKARKRLKEPKLQKSGATLFWAMVRDLIENNTANQFSLATLAKELLKSTGNFPESKKDQQKAMARMTQALAIIFFEHFCCHYYFQTRHLPNAN